MRHYFGYDINGVLKSVEVYGPAGWPSAHCMEDPDCDEASVVSLRESRAKDSPEVIDWVLYDCPCKAGQGDLLQECVCYNDEFATCFVDVQTKTLAKKPLRTVLVDDVPVAHMEVITRDPGTQVVFKVQSSGMPDGELAHCNQKGMVDLTLEDEWDLTFTNGSTETKTLTAPAQGTKGALMISGKLLRPLAFILRGFAS